MVSVSYEGEEGGAELLADTPNTVEEGSTELRQRRPVDVGQVSSSLTDKDHCIVSIEHLTQVRVNLLYDENKEELKLFLHEAANLPGGDLPDPPDPQCKIYLMPGKKKKKKTEVFKDSVNPKFNEEFDFSVDIKDLKEMYLKVC